MPRLDYAAPGVYIEEIDRGSRPIDGVSTNVGGFIGFTEAVRGGAELFKPMLVTSWDQYRQYFAREGADGFTEFDAYLPFAVQGWFLNGGGRCYVMSISTEIPGTASENTETEVGYLIKTATKKPALRFALKPEVTRVTVEITPGEPAAMPDDPDADPPVATEFFTVRIIQDDVEQETYKHLTMDRQVPSEVGTYVETAINEGVRVRSAIQAAPVNVESGEQAVQTEERSASQYIIVSNESTQGLPLTRRPVNGQYEVAPPLVLPTPRQFYGKVLGVRDEQTGIQGSFEFDDITILAFPDLMKAYEARRPDGTRLLELNRVHGIMETMISLCENANPNPANRMVVLDAPPDCVKPQRVAQWLGEFGRRSMYAALYYPWLKVPNPRKEGRPILVPPCGHMMGIWSRTDESRGVYKAPANETPRGVIGLGYDCNFREQELLNPLGINCIRTFPNRGIKVWGARTLVEPTKTEWRYISVRRLMSYIEKSIENGTQWVVFEPNDQDLWARVTRTISNFLERLWREGALFGATPEQAFYVKCDEKINTPETMLLGRLYVEVGISPVRPAEFVIFRISQWNGQED